MIMYSVVNLEGIHASRAEARRRSSTFAKGMLRTLLQVLTGVPGSAWALSTDRYGKPTAHSQGQLVTPEVSISHSRSWIAAAVSTVGPIGIDIECQRPGRDVIAIAESSFGDKERAEVAIGGPDSFYRIWTLREAMAKAVGVGLPMVIDKKDRASNMTASGKCSATIDNLNWLLLNSQPTDGVHLALAVVAHSYHGLDEMPILVGWHPTSPQLI